MGAPRVGLVLGAGGVAGHAFHVGVLKAIHEVTGWDPRSAAAVVGTSAGSVVGTGLRAGLSATDAFARTVGEPVSPEAETILAAVPTRSDSEWRTAVDAPRRPLPASPRLTARLALRPWRARPGLVLAGLLPHGRLDPGSIRDDVDAVIEGTRFDRSTLRVTAVRLSDGERVAFGGATRLPEGSTWGRAVSASCAIPGVFAPVEIGGELFVDGGAHSPTNADVLAGEGLDLVVVSSPMSSARGSGLRAVDAPVRLGYRFRLASELRRLDRGLPVVTFQPTRHVLRAAGINAMAPSVRVPVARASYESAYRRLTDDPGLLGDHLDAGASTSRSGAGGR